MKGVMKGRLAFSAPTDGLQTGLVDLLKRLCFLEVTQVLCTHQPELRT